MRRKGEERRSLTGSSLTVEEKFVPMKIPHHRRGREKFTSSTESEGKKILVFLEEERS